MIIRHGGYGDAIQATSVIPYLQKDGYLIDWYGNDRAWEIIKADPRINKFIHHEDGSVPINKLEDHWQKIADEGKYDKVINLTGTVENELLFAYPQPMYFKPIGIRRFAANKNYFDAHVERAGYKPNKPRPSLCLSQEEKQKGKAWRRKHKNKFVILWAMAGTSVHKVYRYFETVTRRFLETHPDAELVTVGDYPTKLLTYAHPRVTNTMFWEMPFRDSLILAKYADLVAGPETGVLNAAAGFGSRTLCLLSHSSKRNLTLYWPNDYSLQAPVWCSPCHLLHKYAFIWRHKCQVGNLDTPRCCEHGPGDVLENMERAYDNWKKAGKAA